MRARILLVVMAAPLLLQCSPQPGDASMKEAKGLMDLLEGPKVEGVQETAVAGGREALESGNFDRAAQLYQQALDRKPEDTTTKLALANALRRGGHCNDALPHYEAMLAADAGNVEALEGKGLCLMVLEEPKEASKILAEVLVKDKTRWKSLNAIGILFASKGKVPEAVAYFEKANSYAGSEISVMNNLGLVYLLDRRTEQAIGIFEKAQRRMPTKSPDRPRIEMNLALAYALAGDMDKAQKIASKHVSEAELYNNLGFFAKLAQDETLAKDYLNLALSKSPTFYKRAWENLQTLQKNE